MAEPARAGVDHDRERAEPYLKSRRHALVVDLVHDLQLEEVVARAQRAELTEPALRARAETASLWAPARRPPDSIRSRSARSPWPRLDGPRRALLQHRREIARRQRDRGPGPDAGRDGARRARPPAPASAASPPPRRVPCASSRTPQLMSKPMAPGLTTPVRRRRWPRRRRPEARSPDECPASPGRPSRCPAASRRWRSARGRRRCGSPSSARRPRRPARERACPVGRRAVCARGTGRPARSSYGIVAATQESPARAAGPSTYVRVALTRPDSPRWARCRVQARPTTATSTPTRLASCATRKGPTQKLSSRMPSIRKRPIEYTPM